MVAQANPFLYTDCSAEVFRSWRHWRGRTLDDSFIILDEAQNTSREQMKMFLTRMGFGSKMVITGDRTQIDLPGRTTSGLVLAECILRDIEGIAFVELSSADVVRHRLVADIIDAYARHDENNPPRQSGSFVFIALIPGELLETAAGSAFGPVLGTVLCYAGRILSSSQSFMAQGLPLTLL